jgi:hypothetical protein
MTEKNKGGRPKAVIDWSQVDEYLHAGCSGTVIAEMLGIHPNTLYEACRVRNNCGFSDYSLQKKEVGDDLLHYRQFKLAMAGDRSMLIWLGKQRLGQTDKVIQDHKVNEQNFQFKFGGE